MRIGIFSIMTFAVLCAAVSGDAVTADPSLMPKPELCARRKQTVGNVTVTSWVVPCTLRVTHAQARELGLPDSCEVASVVREEADVEWDDYAFERWYKAFPGESFNWMPWHPDGPRAYRETELGDSIWYEWDSLTRSWVTEAPSKPTPADLCAERGHVPLIDGDWELTDNADGSLLIRSPSGLQYAYRCKRCGDIAMETVPDTVVIWRRER